MRGQTGNNLGNKNKHEIELKTYNWKKSDEHDKTVDRNIETTPNNKTQQNKTQQQANGKQQKQWIDCCSNISVNSNNIKTTINDNNNNNNNSSNNNSNNNHDNNNNNNINYNNNKNCWKKEETTIKLKLGVCAISPLSSLLIITCVFFLFVCLFVCLLVNCCFVCLFDCLFV